MDGTHAQVDTGLNKIVDFLSDLVFITKSQKLSLQGLEFHVGVLHHSDGLIDCLLRAQALVVDKKGNDIVDVTRFLLVLAP